MAIETIDHVIANVMSMIELDGLHDRRVLIGPVRRAHDDHRHRERSNEDRSDRDPHDRVDRVGPPREQRCHPRAWCNGYTIETGTLRARS
jgi:hypothetical protein